MTDANAGSRDPAGQPPESFRWQAYFQKSTEPLFFLNRQRRLLFANHAWESLTGLALADLRGQVCKRRRLGPDCTPAEAVQALLAPPAEVLDGKMARSRRLVHASIGNDPRPGGPRWWDIAFFPIRAGEGLLGMLGKISLVPREGLFENQPLPEKIIALRERLAEEFSLENLIAHAPAMTRVREQVRLAAQLQAPASLLGEPGTGKRWLARCIHRQSARREGTFALLNCPGLPQQALAEALFGEGGLTRRRQLGTLYLHEPGHLPREMQDRLCSLADAWSEQAGPALLAGFSTDPHEEVRSGRLLSELHRRLSTLLIPVPPLRERLEDLAELTARLLARAQLACGKEISGLADDAQAVLRAYRWPGNIAELYQVLLDACVRAKGERIEAGDLPFHLRSAPVPRSKPLPLDAVLEQVERRLLILALRHTHNNKSEAAELLSIWRQRLVRRMEALGIKDTPPREEKHPI